MYLYIGMILLICVLLFVLSLLFRKAKAEKIFVFLSKPPCQTRCTML